VTDLHPLEPGPPRSARDLVAALRLAEGRGERPRVVAAMIASVDGRATVGGRSVALGNPADRALLRELRAGADAILVGSRTVAAERYARLLDADQRARRASDGRPEHPLVAMSSRNLALPLEAPLFDEPGTPIVVFTESGGDPPPTRAPLEVVRFAPGALDFPGILAALHVRGVRGVSCEGGPSLLRELVAQQCLDDLLLTVSPLVVGGDAPRTLEGHALDEPARLRLVDVHRAGDHLFLHYGAGT
jgi:riboflavin biosynthesis pyrimidine reductase